MMWQLNSYMTVLLVIIVSLSLVFYISPKSNATEITFNKPQQTSNQQFLSSQNQIAFSGYNWTVRNQDNSFPGPNNWSGSNQNVWVDGNGWLHLKITNQNGVWYCPQIDCTQILGYGTYTFHTNSRVDAIDKNAVLGLFIYQDDNHEVDIEYSRWGTAGYPNTAFTVQPPPHQENVTTLTFETTLNQTEVTNLFVWNTSSVQFATIEGNYTLKTAPPGSIIKQWVSSRSCASTGEVAIMNLWLFRSLPPSDGEPVEVVVTGFEFTPISAPEPTGTPPPVTPTAPPAQSPTFSPSPSSSTTPTPTTPPTPNTTASPTPTPIQSPTPSASPTPSETSVNETQSPNPTSTATNAPPTESTPTSHVLPRNSPPHPKQTPSAFPSSSPSNHGHSQKERSLGTPEAAPDNIVVTVVTAVVAFLIASVLFLKVRTRILNLRRREP